jgi:hypothetical protein
MNESGSDATELQLIREERMSTQQCLRIVAQLSDHINQIQLTTQRRGSSSGSTDSDAVPENITNEGLQECKKSLQLTAVKLEGHMNELIDQLVTKLQGTTISKEELANVARLRGELDATRQCMDICSKADIHLKETVSVISNYGTGDTLQFMVSTKGKPLHGSNRGVGWRTRQVGGLLSDDSVQQLSRDMSSSRFQDAISENPASRGASPPVPDDGMENRLGSEFQERYGEGFKLTSNTTAGAPKSSSRPAEAKFGNSSKE